MPETPRVILVLHPGAGYDRGIFRGIARYAQHYGPWVFLPFWDQGGMANVLPFEVDIETLRHKRGSRNKSKSFTQMLRRLDATGIIGRLILPEIIDAIFSLKLPTVGMDLSDEQLADSRFRKRISEIRPDAHRVGRMAAEHLLERGFRRFAFCGHPKGPNWSRMRGEGFCARLEEAGFACDFYQPPQTSSAVIWNRECPAVVAWLRSLQKPVGIMACNDIRGRQVTEACSSGSMHVPNDVAVVGADEDLVHSELSNPPLSSVAINGEQGGYQAAELLHRMMLGQVKRPQRILVDPLWVTPRLSTDVIAIEDREVAEAVRYIRETARRPIRIMDIVAHLSISRRALEIRFHRSLGWSIREEIERVRIEFAKQLLAETDVPIGKVAENTGFSGEDHLGKTFRRVTETTPAKYRREHRVT
jgi:LacI family transcriptional regulator